jgi:hypothetical protein
MRIGRTATLLVGIVVGFVLTCSLGQGIAAKGETSTLPPIFKPGATIYCAAGGFAGRSPVTVTAVSGSWIRVDKAKDGTPGGSFWMNTDSGVFCTGPDNTVP